jgi:hypothetical protein
MMPRARSGPQRITTTAAIAANRGASTAEIEKLLLKQYNFITPEDAANYALQGELAVARGDQLSAVLSGESGIDMNSPIRGVTIEQEATVYVVLSREGEPDEIRQIRAPIVPGQTYQQFANYVDAILEKWGSDERYKATVSGYSVGFMS